MRILRIIARLNVGGPARHVVLQTHNLQDEVFQSWLIAGSVPDGEEGMSYLADESGVYPIYIPDMSRELSFKDVTSLIKVYREMKRIRPDVLHTHTAKAGAIGRAAGFIYKWLTFRTLLGQPRHLKVVHTFHGHVFHSYYGKLKTKIFVIIEKILARVATDRIVVISDQQLREINETYGIGRKGQFEVIPLGIDLTPFVELPDSRHVLRQSIGVKDHDFLVGFVGRLTEIKNIPMLLKVAKKMASDDPKVRFLIVGDGHMRAELEGQAADMGLQSSVSFLGNRMDTENVYPAFDAVALTSLNEGTPLSLIEAMACGKAVISTSVGGVTDLLGVAVKNQGGFSVCERGIGIRSNSVDEFVNGLKHLVASAELRASLEVRAREYALANFSKDRLVRDTKLLYQKLTEENL